MRSRFCRPRLCRSSRNGESLSPGMSSDPLRDQSSALPPRDAGPGPRRGLLALPALASPRCGSRTRVTARVRGPAEPDLVPGPGMGVERLHDVAHHHRERACDVERRSTRRRAALPWRSGARSRTAPRRARPRTRRRLFARASSSSPRATQAPDLVVVGHVVVRQPSRRRAWSFSSTYASTGMRGSRSCAVTTSQNARASAPPPGRRSGSAARPRRARARPAASPRPSAAPARARRSRGSGRASAASCRGAAAAGRAVGSAAASAGAALESTSSLALTIAAAIPSAPTRQSEPGRQQRRPHDEVVVGSRKPPGRLRTPCTCVTIADDAVEEVERRDGRQRGPRGPLARDAGDARGGQRRREHDRRPHPLVAERALVVLEVHLERERRGAERRRRCEQLLHAPFATLRSNRRIMRPTVRASARMSSRPWPGRERSGTSDAVLRLEHAVEQHRLDAHVVVEVLEVAEPVDRRRTRVRRAAARSAPRRRGRARDASP